jgi:hypothetical protein
MVRGGNATLDDYGSESDIARSVRAVLVDVAEALKPVLGELKVSFISELDVFGDRADLWILRRLGVPVGVVEVKRPGRTDAIFNSEYVAGQIFDYMRRLREFHGLDHVFGIVSTYREWRIVWLADCDDAAFNDDRTRLLAHSGLQVDLRPPAPAWESWQTPDGDVVAEAQPQSSPAKERVVRAGRVMRWDDPALVVTLASVLLKMVTSPATRLKQLLDPGRKYIKVGEKDWMWAMLPNGTPELRYWPMPNANVATFLLLLHLGDGVNGRAWLAMTLAGVACVLKFPKESHDSDSLHGEVEIWRTVWGVDGVRVQQLANKPALVMPYVRTCSAQADQTEEVRDATRVAVARMAAAGWRHNDVKWEHVGLYKQAGTLRAVLIDAGDVLSVPPEERADAQAEMLSALGLSLS